MRCLDMLPHVGSLTSLLGAIRIVIVVLIIVISSSIISMISTCHYYQ